MFLFQMVFMDTTATILTGAMAERWKFRLLHLRLLRRRIIYPVFGYWVWGGGWLAAARLNSAWATAPSTSPAPASCT